MPIPERRQAIGAILAGILIVADANQRCLQQTQHGREHLFARQAPKREVRIDTLAYSRQRPAEIQYSMILRLVAYLAPSRVIAILLASSPISPGRLDMAGRKRADPYVCPSRGDGQRFDAADVAAIGDRLPPRIAVAEPAPGTPTRETRVTTLYIAEPCLVGSDLRIGCITVPAI